MADGPKISRWLAGILPVLFLVVTLAGVLDGLLGSPYARWYGSLSPAGHWAVHLVSISLAAIVFLIVVASLIERLVWRVRKKRDA